MTFHVLFVCTGNICRSPLAERLFLARADPAAPVAAASAGTRGLAGHPMDRASALALRELGGGSGDGHVARLLTPEIVAAADLVLTAQQAHREAVVALAAGAHDRAFTLREFGRLCAGLPQAGTGAGALRARVATAASLRSPAPRRFDDIADPFGAPLAVARSCAAQVAEAVDAVLAGLGLAGPAEASA